MRPTAYLLAGLTGSGCPHCSRRGANPRDQVERVPDDFT